MKKLVIGIFLLASCGGSGDPCADLCDRIETKGCENQPSLDECLGSCEAPENCEKEYDAYLNCLVKQTTADDLTCDEELGDVTFPEDVCEAEAANMLVCVLSDMDME